MKLENIKTISGKIHLVTGLHIGASNETIEIGGLDQPIIKNPLPDNGEPYIPGSSLKGKMRSLIEIKEDRYQQSGNNKGAPCQCGDKDCPVCPVFGTSAAREAKKAEDIGSTRLIVRDAMLTDYWQNQFRSGDLPMEVKYENVINRISGTAKHPRPLERVPAGVEFAFNISFKVFDSEKDKSGEYFQTVLKAMKMLEMDALGGSGSRGSGQVKFTDVKIDGIEQEQDFLEAVEL
ncbi:MAG: type III-A CRISPR-associated RAMP protein Csm3 [Thermodesulfobacteriota bacterium]|nr:type III-A CRISPR-associated RAMP protein Csm3 [Thermodesulfobacteriota bacterium]